MAMEICLSLEMSTTRFAILLLLLIIGNKIATKTLMTARTTSSSISEKARDRAIVFLFMFNGLSIV